MQKYKNKKRNTMILHYLISLVMKWKQRLPQNVLTEAEIKLTEYVSFKKYPEWLRLVRYHAVEQERDFAFLTNLAHLTALEVANLYNFSQMAEASPQNQEVLGNKRKCSPHTNLYRHHCLLSCGYRPDSNGTLIPQRLSALL